MILGIWLLTVGLCVADQAQEFRPKPPALPESEIEKAIQDGLSWLKGASPKPPPPPARLEDTNELVFYALLHGGVPPADPVFKAYLKAVVDRDPDRLYNSALAAMGLAKLDRAGYQWRLVHHAQFIQDNQCENGQWAYGAPVELDAQIAAAFPLKGANYGSRYPQGYRPVPGKGSGRKISIVQRARVSKLGDNSNAQYAALGLRACAEGDLLLDPRCLGDALRWWEGDQDRDGGWGYSRGQEDAARPTMTAGGVGSLVILRYLLRKSWTEDPHVRRGNEWLDANWKTKVAKWQNYYLYGLERVGMLYGTDRIGSHDWFDEGGRWLLDHQESNGSWNRNVLETCFALLFLRRATAPLAGVATGGRGPAPEAEKER